MLIVHNDNDYNWYALYNNYDTFIYASLHNYICVYVHLYKSNKIGLATLILRNQWLD